ncbi:MFS transporter [Cellvibrio sp. NN19]|uniref:MFS transporter n=1 Tax=Cellvibrio chitinivorans TaxID=3102792 RepID=UPI002B406B64|nr:MFS transporter [Cellvibrio sp. NN19]
MKIFWRRTFNPLNIPNIALINTDSTIEFRMTNRIEKLPYGALLALSITGFICVMTETLPAGLLPLISADMSIPIASSGQLVTAYALGSLFFAIPLTVLTRSWSRRSVLLFTVSGFTVFNALTALSHNLPLTYLSRFLAGCCAGLAWSLIAGYARSIVKPHQQGAAMAFAMAGTPVALSIGVPIGTWISQVLGWRETFGIMSLISILLIIWIIFIVPNVSGQKNRIKFQITKVLGIKGVKPILAVVLTWMVSHNILYTYIAPFSEPSGLNNNIDAVLFVFGITSLAGIFFTGKLIDRHLRVLTLFSVFTFFISCLLLFFYYSNPMIFIVCIGIWGLTFGGAATLLNTALADAAGEWTDIAMSLTVVSWNSAISLGGIFGGLLIQEYGIHSLAVAPIIFVFTAFIIVKINIHYAFTRSPSTE